MITKMEENYQEYYSPSQVPSTTPTLSQLLASQSNPSQSSIVNQMELTRAVQKLEDNSPFSLLSQHVYQNISLDEQKRSQQSSRLSTQLSQVHASQLFDNDNNNNHNDSNNARNDRLTYSSDSENKPPKSKSNTSLKLMLVAQGLDRVFLTEELTICGPDNQVYHVKPIDERETNSNVDNNINDTPVGQLPISFEAHFTNDRKLKRNSAARTRKSQDQIMKLKKAFEMNQYPNKECRLKLAAKLNLTDSQVRLWFQHERNKFA